MASREQLKITLPRDLVQTLDIVRRDRSRSQYIEEILSFRLKTEAEAFARRISGSAPDPWPQDKRWIRDALLEADPETSTHIVDGFHPALHCARMFLWPPIAGSSTICPQCRHSAREHIHPEMLKKSAA